MYVVCLEAPKINSEDIRLGLRDASALGPAAKRMWKRQQATSKETCRIKQEKVLVMAAMLLLFSPAGRQNWQPVLLELRAAEPSCA